MYTILCGEKKQKHDIPRIQTGNKVVGIKYRFLCNISVLDGGIGKFSQTGHRKSEYKRISHVLRYDPISCFRRRILLYRVSAIRVGAFLNSIRTQITTRPLIYREG